ncbi:nitroreductase family protein [Frigidibacter oleivorans]|uniref:nitroreductase family protein n=1 Tax=Frigidibacter oleivorans TaxID=2487129 RepID=UPI000F8C657D|nr:nitroreductase [Frigidibacter oleivorans]
MPHPNPHAVDFLLARRSRPAKTLTGPAPDRVALEPILTAALRVPDHGKLEPWRLIVLERAALDRVAEVAARRGEAQGLPEEQTAKGVSQFRESPLCVAVVAVPRPTDKVPEWEQLLSAGCVCLSLVNAALASGWGACWLTGWPAYDAGFLTDALDLAPGERIAGFVHLGTEGAVPPDRPRPDLAATVRWVSA